MKSHLILDDYRSPAKPILVPASRRRPDRSPIQCIYVTDLPRDADVLAWLVAPRGIQVHRAASAAEACQIIDHLRSRVLLCEMELAVGSWLEVLGTVQRQHPETAVVLALPRFDGEVWVEALLLGCYDVLLKPFNPTELRNGLEDAYRYSCCHLVPAPAPPAETRKAESVTTSQTAVTYWRRCFNRVLRLGDRLNCS